MLFHQFKVDFPFCPCRQSVDSSNSSSTSFLHSDFSFDSSVGSNTDGGSDPEDDPDDDPSDSDYVPSDSEPSDDECRTVSKNSVPESLLKEVAKSKASYRICEKLLKVGVKITDGIPQHYSLSKTSLWSKITKIRHDERTNHLEKLASSRGQIVIQFDGKRCHKLNARHLGREERLVVLCHTDQCDIPLGFLKLDSHTGYDCAVKLMESIRMNGLENRVIGVCCDTENVNTGAENGAVHLLENMLNIELLRLSCRHHVFEIVLKAVFVYLFGGTTGSEDTTFDFLRENWETIKRNNFEYAPVFDELLSPFLRRLSQTAINLLSCHTKYFRNDYSELIDLSLKFLGVNTDKCFHVPGATNNARWMFRAIYALKSFLFRDLLDLDDDFFQSLQRFCLFVTLIYVKFWNQCSNSTDAPYNDLQFLKELDAYKQFDPEIAEVACTAMKRHLWYLSDELIVLALFSEKVSAEDKNEMRLLLNEEYEERTQNSLRYTDEIRGVQNLQLHSFISDRSSYLFNLLEIDTNFLYEDSNDWADIGSYQAASKKVNKLITVVNDSAERAIQLGSKLIDEQRVQSEMRLQDFFVSSYDG